MSNADLVIYSVDTSTLMDWQDRYYPIDVFPSIVRLFDELIEQDRLTVAQFVHEEVEAIGSDALRAWLKERKHICCPTSEHLELALDILKKFPGLSDPKATFDEADAYVIALAELKQGRVVTQETPAAAKHRPRRSHFIPDVCRELSIPCITMLDLMRNEGCLL